MHPDGLIWLVVRNKRMGDVRAKSYKYLQVKVMVKSYGLNMVNVCGCWASFWNSISCWLMNTNELMVCKQIISFTHHSHHRFNWINRSMTTHQRRIWLFVVLLLPKCRTVLQDLYVVSARVWHFRSRDPGSAIALNIEYWILKWYSFIRLIWLNCPY